MEVIVGKTIEQSLLEVMEEEELEDLREQQRKFHESRKREQLATQRLEEQERRLSEERERRIAQQREVFYHNKFSLIDFTNNFTRMYILRVRSEFKMVYFKIFPLKQL